MDVGSEIGHKMRSAIKAKLTELPGCYVDDELPDYVMVMVANKRTRAQMEDDLQLFLGDNTQLFVNWLHQVLKKLEEVTVTTPLSQIEKHDKAKSKSEVKEAKSKDKKDKTKDKKLNTSKKSKKKDKDKKKKKEEKKAHKAKKKSKEHERIRPNVPPLLMNMEKESEPSITDVFAGQILKNHGITVDSYTDVGDKEIKPDLPTKKTHFPIIDPATISSGSVVTTYDSQPSDKCKDKSLETNKCTKPTHQFPPREEQIKEITKIEARIQDLRQKLAEKKETMSDDEDFLNIRTEAEELMNDFAEDVYQEIKLIKPPVSAVTTTPPLQPDLIDPKDIPKSISKLPAVPTPLDQDTLPQIELQLPKRPLRDRLGEKEVKKPTEISKESTKRRHSPESLTPEKEPQPKSSVKSRLGDLPTPQEKQFISDTLVDKLSETSSKKLTSKVSVLETRDNRPAPASVVRVRPRPRPGSAAAPASALLLRAVADAHKSLLNIPPKVTPEEPMVKRALVMPMRRTIDPQKIVIQVPTDRIPSAPPSQEQSDCEIDFDTESLADLEVELDNKSNKTNSDRTKKETEYIPAPITRTLVNKTVHYVPSKRSNSISSEDPNVPSIEVETINIHNTTIGKEKGPQFVVTLDGLDPNVFLAKKLKTEGLIDDDELLNNKNILKKKQTERKETKDTPDADNCKLQDQPEETKKDVKEKKRLSGTIEDNNTQIIITAENETTPLKSEKRKSTTETPDSTKKRKASPIVFDVDKKDRERKESVSSDSNVTITATGNSKYDSLPSLPDKRPVCRAFPACTWGAACAFSHPPCKFAAACTRRGCMYAHPTTVAGKGPVVASHVVPAANYKTISNVNLPNMCKYYPQCANPACHYFHPKPCRYGKACLNKLECNFYHHDVPVKWKNTFKS
ncbi:Zinc finger CCCH domain-containing protein 14 [Eumeta japonica]|uniref:Zinc finger CCCH domain-containing protein 14 n=1 Tax=Eumeta variegata TaxID=151549 RepID=A0A4C1Y3F4_EUMVA|nr:Zinc finger CCCH domain-containing protein 14 [Eumeta japonica]